jgi:hypothetical protein
VQQFSLQFSSNVVAAVYLCASTRVPPCRPMPKNHIQCGSFKLFLACDAVILASAEGINGRYTDRLERIP